MANPVEQFEDQLAKVDFAFVTCEQHPIIT